MDSKTISFYNRGYASVKWVPGNNRFEVINNNILYERSGSDQLIKVVFIYVAGQPDWTANIEVWAKKDNLEAAPLQQGVFKIKNFSYISPKEKVFSGWYFLASLNFPSSKDGTYTITNKSKE